MAGAKTDVLYGTLGLMVLKTLDALGPMHGYGIARRIEQISGGQFALNQGSVYPGLVRLEQEGWIAPRWGESETGRRVKFYSITRLGKKRLDTEQAEWERSAEIIGRFVKLSEGEA